MSSASYEGGSDEPLLALRTGPITASATLAGNLAISASWKFLRAQNNSTQQALTTMLFPSIAALAAVTSFFSLAASHNIQMKAHQRECFHEALHKDDKMTVTFQVGDREFGGSGNLEIDFWV